MLTKRLLSGLSGAVLGLGLLLVAAAPASAVNVDTYISGPDTLGNAAQATETTYVRTETNDPNAAFISKDESPNVQSDGDIRFIENIPLGTVYFVLKFGGGLVNFFVFENIPELNIAAWTLDQVGGLDNLSHISYFVPLPGALLLLLSGLAGLLGLRFWRDRQGEAEPTAA